jgi:hypothetical protein
LLITKNVQGKKEAEGGDERVLRIKNDLLKEEGLEE